VNAAPNVRDGLTGVAALLDRLREAVDRPTRHGARNDSRDHRLRAVLAKRAPRGWSESRCARADRRRRGVAEVQTRRAEAPARASATSLRRLITPVDEDKKSPASPPHQHMEGIEWPSSRSGSGDGCFRSVARLNSRGRRKERRLCYVGLTPPAKVYLHGGRGIGTAGWSLRAVSFLDALPPKSSRSGARRLVKPLRGSGAMPPRPHAAWRRGAAAAAGDRISEEVSQTRRIRQSDGYPPQIRRRMCAGSAMADLRVSVDFEIRTSAQATARRLCASSAIGKRRG